MKTYQLVVRWELAQYSDESPNAAMGDDAAPKSLTQTILRKEEQAMDFCEKSYQEDVLKQVEGLNMRCGCLMSDGIATLPLPVKYPTAGSFAHLSEAINEEFRQQRKADQEDLRKQLEGFDPLFELLNAKNKKEKT